MTRKTLNIYVSYVQPDQQFVQRLCDSLRSRSIAKNIALDIFLPLQLTAGDAVVEAIASMIAKSDVVLMVISPGSSSRIWVGSEIALALAERDRSKKRLIPILLGDPDGLLPVPWTRS